MMLISNPRATPLVIVSYQDGMFIVRLIDTNTGVICLNPDVVADAVKEVCKKCLQKQRRNTNEGHKRTP